jgi:hypothetical protein
MKSLNAEYWNQQYITGKTEWDMGFASPPLTDYFSQIKNKDSKILIPGAGNA